MNKNTRSTIMLVTLLTILYLVAGKLGLKLALVNPHASAVWPATGLALAACLLWGYRVWPGVLLGAFLVNYTTSANVFLAMGIAVGNTLEAVVGTYLLNRLANGKRAFSHTLDFFKFILFVCGLSTTISATVGVFGLSMAGLASGGNFFSIWWNWWLGDATGALLLTPALVLWGIEPLRSWTVLKVFEAGFLFSAGLLVGLVVFLGWKPFGFEILPLPLGILPLVVWSAFRFGPTGVATITLLLSLLAVLGMLQGLQTLDADSLEAGILLVQIYLDTIAVTGLGLAMVVAERRRITDENTRLYNEARALNTELEERVRQRTQALELSQAEAQALNRSLLTARETERTEIAREIHDQLGQQLTLLSFDLTYLQEKLDSQASEEIRERIESMFTLLKETSGMIRNLATQLRPSMLDELGLLPTLRWQLQEFEARTGVTSNLVTSLEELTLPPEVATALFRVCQEALTNVARHAQATAVEICCEQDSSYLVIQIKDNGRGIKAHEQIPNHSLGLLGMRERVRLIGGDLEINGTPLGGTVVRVKLPWGQN